VYGAAASRLMRLPPCNHDAWWFQGVHCAPTAACPSVGDAQFQPHRDGLARDTAAICDRPRPARGTFYGRAKRCPVDPRNRRPCPREFGIRPGERVLLAVGTLERHKGHRVLLEALSHLEREKDKVPWRLIIAGGRGGDQHDSLIEFAEETGLNDRVHVVTNRNDIPDLLALADIFVMPSLFEGLPMALLEAMIAGKAIVASATSGIPEAIESGREGLLVSPGDVAALARALQSLLTDEARRNALGRRRRPARAR